MRNTIIVGVHRGLNEVEPLDIKQMIGRSGRVGLDTRGDAYVLLPQTKFMRYKVWCENIPPISSTMNDQEVLAFHIVSEISEGVVYDVETLMTWYNRSLAAFQNNFLDRIDAENLLSKLEKIKVIEKENDKYKITNLGRVAAYLYFSPYSIAGWYFNFNRLFREDRLDDYSTSWALANIPDNNNNFIGREQKELVKTYQMFCNSKKLEINDACASVGAIIHACLNYSDDFTIQQKLSVKLDNERVFSALEMIDNIYAHWNMSNFFKKLQLRIDYEVSEEQTELCVLKGIGGVRVRCLFDYGVKTLKDFVKKSAIAKEILGEVLYQRILIDNKDVL